MSRSSGLSVKKPVSVWNREVEVNFRDLFKALGKAVVSAKFGKFDLAINSLVDSVAAFELKKEAGQMAWLLLYRSTARAMFLLIEGNLLLIREATRGFQSLAGQAELNEENLKAIADKLDYAVDARDLAIERRFFDQPRNFPVLEDLKAPLIEWLENFGLNHSQASSIGERFPSYFVFALNDEWRSRRADYNLISEEISTPFTGAAEIEQAWLHYYAWLQKRLDEPLFQGAFSLSQIYIPLRAYFEEKKDTNPHERMPESERLADKQVEKIVVNLEEELNRWVENPDEKEAIRILSGGPGYGKSSVARIFAEKQTRNEKRRVLFIPLHLFEPSEDLVDSVKKFVELEGFFPSEVNLLHATEGENRLLLIFDGLDELSMQGKVGNEVAQQFVKEVQRKVDIFNRREPRLKILICGRDIAVQASAGNLDRKTKILHLLPYFLEESERDDYTDANSLLAADQRDLWWANYSKLNGKDYTDLLPELKKENLTEITALPLLNYLVALSHEHEKIDFSREVNLNSIYEKLLASVYQRENVWADKQHKLLEEVTQKDFFRIFEEIALAAWHSGEGRKVSVKEIEKHCENSGLKPLLEKFQEKAKDGVSSLLVAFYFKKSGARDEELNETFEFTHKSFGEYLTARRIARGVERIHNEMKRRQDSYESGWDEIQALTHWVKLCGAAAIDSYLLNFIRGEVALYPAETVIEWQQTLSRLFSHVLHQGTPMEKLADARPIFKEEIRQARNSEETLLATLNACALVTKQVSDIKFPEAISFRDWLQWVDTPISREILTFISLKGAIVSGANLRKANLKGADLEGAIFTLANLFKANFSEANLTGAVFTGANLIHADFTGANLTSATFTLANLYSANLTEATLIQATLTETMMNSANLLRANLTDAILTQATLIGANLEGTILERATMTEANLSRANLDGADFSKATITEMSVTRENLPGAIWTNGKRIIGVNDSNLIFEDDAQEEAD